MIFEELLMVIDPNADGGEILELEFRGNEEYNRVRSDCVEILKPLFEYQVNSIGINDNGEQRIWLDPPKQANTLQTDCSEKPNNCERITEDGVTCAKYPACDDCLGNSLNKVKGSERSVKGSTDCAACELDGKADVCKICRASIYEPQPDCAWK